MDRRTLLAFVLLTLVLFLYQFLVPKPQTPEVEARREPTETVAVAQSAGSESPPEVTPVSDGEEPGSTITSRLGIRRERGADPAGLENILLDGQPIQTPLSIRNDLYSAELDPEGGAITFWKLRDYTDADEEPVDLVADPQTGVLRLFLASPEGTVDLSRTEYLIRTERRGETTTAVLEAEDEAGARVTLTYTFQADRYAANLDVQIDGVPNENGDVDLVLSFANGIGFPERNPKTDVNSAAGMAVLGKDLVKGGGSGGFGCGGGPRSGWTKTESGVIRWAGTRSKYFLLAAIPRPSPDGAVEMTRPDAAGPVRTNLRLPISVTGSSRFEFDIYAGPMKYRDLETYGVGLERAVDLGWSFLVPFSRLLLRFFQAVHSVVPNYGVVILILSILTKLVFYPLTRKSMESMKAMQALKPEMDRLNAKYKEDPQKRNQAMMELYKRNKVNPAGGCLPILVQMPVFIALYGVLNSSIELRKAPFALWIQDLSAPDKVGQIFGLPIHIMPILMAGSMFFQQKMTPTDPRQAAMMYLMPILMLVFFYPMPSGLVMYWTVNNLMHIGQQALMNRSKAQTAA